MTLKKLVQKLQKLEKKYPDATVMYELKKNNLYELTVKVEVANLLDDGVEIWEKSNINTIVLK